jgi:diguanylate cyclase (GGDEF)-like protein
VVARISKWTQASQHWKGRIVLLARTILFSLMRLHIAHIPKLILQRRASAILGMIIIAMLWGGVAVVYREDVQQDYHEVERRNQNFAMVFEENVLRSIGEIDKALLYLRRSVEAAKDTTDFQTIVMTTDVLSEIIVQVAIIDAKGISQGSNAVAAPTGPIDVSDREHFRVHVNSKEDKLFISRPLVGRASGRWSVQFTRRFSNKDGSFAGVVVASMDPAHFTSFYDKIDLGATTSVAMVGSDGVVRSSGGGAVPRLSLGQDLLRSKLFSRIQAGSDSVFQDPGSSPEDSLLVTARKVRSYPLWVTVSTRATDVYRASWANLQQNTLIVAFLTVLIMIALEQILRAEAKAKQKAEQLQLTLEHISQGIMLVTKEHQIPIINQRCGELLHLPKDMIEAPPSFSQLSQYGAQSGNFLFSPDTDAASGNGTGYVPREPSISDYKRPDGLFIEVRKTQLPDGGFVQTFTDITTRREAEAHIARLASEDPLTKLPNRRVFRSKLEQLSSRQNPRAGRVERRQDFAVLFLDMDRFKVVNDTLGHRIGDKLLIELARRLRLILRESDILARLGGDEFAILLPTVESRADVETLAKAIVTTMEQPFQVDHHLISSSISIGIAIGPHDGETEDELLVAADLALYAVKLERRGTYRFYQKSMNDDVNDRRQVELDLREALEQGQLELHYQPVVDLRRNAIVGFEALARWFHPVRGMISPAKFIPVAEDCGLIVTLGEWALTEACRTAAQWPDNLKISVNLSPMQLSSPDLLPTISRVLADTGLKARRLTLEITERIFLDETEKTLSILHKLKELGVEIALDDFGTGYSSLSYLRSFPFDTLKIDRSFVSDLGLDTGSNVIVQAVILIASGLGIRTVAEGIETPLQQQILKALGCEEVQGYLFSPPVPIAKVPALIDQWAGKKILAA